MKREKRQPTQIEIMAAMEREKQEKKAARKAAKVRLESYRFPIFFFFVVPSQQVINFYRLQKYKPGHG